MIIGICGKPGSGKGEAAKVLMERGFINGKFSHALKEMFRAFLRYRGFEEDTIERMIEGDLKESSIPALGGKSPRHAMQTLGAWGRNDIHEGLWVETEFDARWAEENLVFDDVRAANEETEIRNRGGSIIYLRGREGTDNGHELEQFVPKVATVIYNNRTLEDLRRQVNQFADDLSWAA